jgi:NAD(P)H dehydrogenase (quinone)
MHALIVVSHPHRQSLTHSVATEIAQGLSLSGGGHTSEIADLAAEGFDPRFTSADVALYRRETPPPPDIAFEQQRIDRADALMLVYPIYWWSMPALLKGWVDRVFTNGWAYDFSPGTQLVKKLRHLQVHLVGIGGSDAGTFERHGYFGAMKTQIDHGIFDYCGAPVLMSEFLLDSETQDPAAHLARARAIGSRLFDPSTRGKVSAAA